MSVVHIYRYFFYFPTDALIIICFRYIFNQQNFFQVMVSDNGTPQLSSTTRIVVTVEDVNDHSPEFDQKSYKFQIPANAQIDQALCQVSALESNSKYSIRRSVH